ncbi:MAG: hypothetical protein AB1757_16655 [Acidobacteriota bacterium]
MLGKFYLWSGVLILGAIIFMTATGREFGGSRRQLSEEERRNPDRYRSYHIFHSGYRSGK